MSRGFLIACGSILLFGVGGAVLGPGRLGDGGAPGERMVERASPIAGPEGVLIEALGIETAGGEFTPVLPRGMPVPAARTLNFATAVDGQQEIRLHLLRGMAPQVAGNTSLGWVRIGGLRGGEEGRARVGVTFRVTADGIALVAFDPGDQRLLPVVPASPPGPP